MRQKGNVDKIFAQEKNITTYNLARMNMLLHGVNFRNNCAKFFISLGVIPTQFFRI
jgi:type I restriction-modification system DNA methylase subunit